MTVCMLRTRADAERLRARLGPDRHVLIVGGGWIGLEVAATARQSGSKVTVLEREARLCARSVQPGVSAHLATLHAANGVALRLNAGLRAVGGSADGRPVAELADGSRSPPTRSCWAWALRPTMLARDAGIACDRGVLVDERCRTSAPDVYAAGDVAVSARPGGGRLRLESWQNAQDQGTAAALSALGLGEAYRPTGAVWSEQYDAMVQIVGFPALAASEVLRAGGCPRAAVGGAGCGRPRRGGRDSERGARTAPAA